MCPSKNPAADHSKSPVLQGQEGASRSNSLESEQLHLSGQFNLGSFEAQQSGRAIQQLRAKYLQTLAGGEVRPIVLVFGQSCSGKSTVMQMLSQVGFVPAERLFTRELRPADAPFERQWQDLLPGKEGSEPENDSYSLESVLWAMYNYGNYYSESAPDVLSKLSSADSTGLAILKGKLLDLPTTLEAIGNLLPGYPVYALRLEVPPSVIARRLSRRKQASKGEAEGRLNKLYSKHEEDQRQILSYVGLYGLQQIPYLKDDEPEQFRYPAGSTRELTQEVLTEYLEPVLKRVMNSSKEKAQAALKPIELDHTTGVVPENIISALTDHLLPRAAKLDLPVYLRGDLAVAAYLGSASEKVPTDIAYTAPTLNGCLAGLLELDSGLVRDFGQTGFQPAQAGSKVLECKAQIVLDQSGATDVAATVEVDAIAPVHIQSSGQVFCYEFFCDYGDQILARQALLPDGQVIQLIPPEHLLVEKLLLGGGADQDGTDLFAAAGLLAIHSFDAPLVHKLVFQQSYSPEQDRAVNDVIAELQSDNNIVTVAQFCTASGYSGGDLVKKLGSRKIQLDKLFNTISDDKEDSNLSISALKQLLMIDRMHQALGRIKAVLAADEVSPGGLRAKLNEHFEPETLSFELNNFEELLCCFAQFEIGRGDIFIRRQLTTREEVERFFTRFEVPQLE